MVNEFFFDSREALFDHLTERCHELLKTAIAERGQASFLVSGGSSPKPLYQRLSEQALEWDKVAVALVDERWVDPDETGSNQRFINDSLMQGLASSATLIAMKNNSATAQEGLQACENSYKNLPAPFDVTIIGMGPDGHTASLFPEAQGLSDALNMSRAELCSVIHATQSEVTGELTERMSLSLFGLLQSRELQLLITGEEKLAVYQRAKQLGPESVSQTPVCAVLQQNKVPVNVYWAP